MRCFFPVHLDRLDATLNLFLSDSQEDILENGHRTETQWTCKLQLVIDIFDLQNHVRSAGYKDEDHQEVKDRAFSSTETPVLPRNLDRSSFQWPDTQWLQNPTIRLGCEIRVFFVVVAVVVRVSIIIVFSNHS